jgi:hypothetical protein
MEAGLHSKNGILCGRSLDKRKGFDEYQTIVPHPDLLVDGHNAVKPKKIKKKALKKNRKAIAFLRVSSSRIYTVDAMIEGTIDDAGMWPCMASSGWFYVLIWKYITGTDRRCTV